MRKLWDTIKDKVIMGLIMSMIAVGGTFMANTGKELWYLPGTVRYLKSKGIKDSILGAHYIERIKKLEQRNAKDSIYLQMDFDAIDRIKKKLKIR